MITWFGTCNCAGLMEFNLKRIAERRWRHLNYDTTRSFLRQKLISPPFDGIGQYTTCVPYCIILEPLSLLVILRWKIPSVELSLFCNVCSLTNYFTFVFIGRFRGSDINVASCRKAILSLSRKWWTLWWGKFLTIGRNIKKILLAMCWVCLCFLTYDSDTIISLHIFYVFHRNRFNTHGFFFSCRNGTFDLLRICFIIHSRSWWLQYQTRCNSNIIVIDIVSNGKDFVHAFRCFILIYFDVL